MTQLRFSPVVSLFAALAALLVAGCTSTGTIGDSTPARNSRGGGWENFRAEAPALTPVPGQVA